MARPPATWLLPLAFAVVLAPAPDPGAAAVRGARPDRARVAALRERARVLFALRERARDDPAVSPDRLQRDLVGLADSLSAAGLDSLASWARYRAAGVLSRMPRRDEAERQLVLAIGDALRARAVDPELAARSLLLDWVGIRNPEESLDAAAVLARLAAVRRDTLRLADVHITRARLFGSLGRWGESLAAAREAARGYESIGFERLQVVALGRCSQALRFLGRRAEALAMTDRAIRLARGEGLDAPLARALLERSALLRHEGRLDEAIASVDEALAIDLRMHDALHEASSRTFRTSVLRAAGRLDEALRESRQVLELLEPRDDAVAILRAYGNYASVLVAMNRPAEADTLIAGAIARFERHLETLPGGRSRAARRTHALGAYFSWAYCRLQRHGPEEALRTLERGRALELKGRLGLPDEPSITAALARLDARRAALITYVEALDMPAVALVVAGGRVRAIPLDTPPDADDATSARTLLASGAPESAMRDVLARIARAWLDPLIPALPPGIERLVIVTPEALSSLPFEALPLAGAPAGTALGDRWAISYVPSVGMLGALASQPASHGPVVAFADPAARGMPALRAARGEARVAVLGGGTLHAGRRATAARFEQAAGRAAVLHLATHAVVDPLRPERSGVRLADPGGLVSVARVESLEVAADLVVLSGCRTAQGPALGYEGVSGLAHAFLGAGARSVVTTLWDVDDRRAARIMAAFYEGLRAGLPRDESLRRARSRLAGPGVPARDRWTFVLMGLGDEPVAALSGGRSAGSAQ